MAVDVNAEKFELANKWIRLLNKRISILRKLRAKGLRKIVIYGASEFALRLLEQYENESDVIEIVGIADKRVSSRGAFYKGIPLLSINDIADLDEDGMCVVITAMGYYREIMDELQVKGVSRFISLKELVYDACCQGSQESDACRICPPVMQN